MATSTAYHEGQRLSYDGHLCTVRYIGKVRGTKGEWLGVEWDDAKRGKHAGVHGGENYFDCVSKASTPASFVRPSRPHDKRRAFVEALKDKYAPQEVSKPEEDLITISGKDVEEVGFDKIRQQQAELQKLRIIVLDGCRIGRVEAGIEGGASRAEVIGQICPLCEQLDLSRNLFETWDEIAALISQLPHLTAVTLDGNRFQIRSTFERSEEIKSVRRLSLNECLLAWVDITHIMHALKGVAELSASGNGLQELTLHLLPSTITVLNLEGNDFEELTDLYSIANLPSLERLSLKRNRVSRIYRTKAVPAPLKLLRFSATLNDIDLSGNQIAQWAFVNDLITVMPGLTSLRLTGNPLYDDLRSTDGAKLDSDDAFMLTLARIKPLMTLNYSRIAPKERLNAETYYLAQIGRELSAVSESDASAILDQHSRYHELCSEYGAPVVVRKARDQINPNSLAARLVRCTIRLDSVAATIEKNHILAPDVLELEIPRSFTIYNVLGLVAKRFHLQARSIKLIWETGEPDIIVKADKSSHSDSEEDDGGTSSSKAATEYTLTPTREEHLYPLTRRLGTWLEAPVANLRVERFDCAHPSSYYDSIY